MAIYTVPPLSSVDFALTTYTAVNPLYPPDTGLTVYTVPALNAVDFALTLYTPLTFPHIDWELLPSAFYGVLKYWTGSAWVKKPIKTYTSSFVSKPLKAWSGSAWELIDN